MSSVGMLGIARYYDTARYARYCSVYALLARALALSVAKNYVTATERTQSCFSELQSSNHCTLKGCTAR
jgi:hypothetical protein